MRRRLLVLTTLAALAAANARGDDVQSAQNASVNVVFGSPGSKTVTLTVCDALGRCSTVSKVVEVKDPRPSQATATLSPLSVAQNLAVVLSASAEGRPPISYDWTILDSRGALVGATSGALTHWIAAVPTGRYSVTVSAHNAAGTAASSPAMLDVLAPQTGGDFYTLSPCRVIDTRSSSGIVGGGAGLTVPVAGRCGVPAAAVAIAANVTAVPGSSPGYLQVLPGDMTAGETATVSFAAAQVRAVGGLFPLSADGAGTLRVRAGLPAGARVDLVVDVSGYFLSASAPRSVVAYSPHLCALGSCIFPAGVPVWMDLATAGSFAAFAYDWDGDGREDQRSAVPLNGHVYPAAGYVRPRVGLVGADGSIVWSGGVDVFIVPPGSSPPQTPAGVRALASGVVPPGPNDPPGTGLRWGYNVSVTSPQSGLVGYLAYTVQAGVERLAGAVRPGGEVLPLPLFTGTVSLRLRALNYSGLSGPSTDVVLPVQ
jgi:hypothetical protein